MEWREEGVILAVRKHGESSAIVEVFTLGHGRHAGVVRGGSSRKMTPILQPGTQVDVSWRARLDEHLGSFAIEPIRSRAAAVMSDRLALAGLNAITALLSFSLAERDPHPSLYERSIAVLDMLGATQVWPLAYLRWELALLDELGFGLDLSSCAATGSTEDLIYVSPKSGQAVSRQGAGEWANRMLPLPGCLLGAGEGDPAEIATAMRTTGHFLETGVAVQLGNKPLPAARQRLMDALGR